MAGDLLPAVEHRLTPFLVREYAHAVEASYEAYHRPSGIAPPTMVHAHKVRLLDHCCPAGAGPDARLHVGYEADHHRLIPAEVTTELSGRVAERFERRGRQYLVLEIEVRDKRTGEVYTTYRDTSVLSFGRKD